MLRVLLAVCIASCVVESTPDQQLKPPPEVVYPTVWGAWIDGQSLVIMTAAEYRRLTQAQQHAQIWMRQAGFLLDECGALAP